MRQIAIAITLAAMAVTAACAQGRLTWEETTHDFGVFKEEVKVATSHIRFKNTGDSSLVITRVRPTCGCTASDYPKRAIAPGDTASIKLTYTATGRPGPFEKGVFVYTNGIPSRSEIKIKGNVIASPETLNEQYPVRAGSLRLDAATIPLGEIAKGHTRMAYLKGYNGSQDSLVVTFDGVPPFIIPKAIPDTVAPGEVMTATFHYDAGKAPLWGPNNDTLSVIAEPLRKGAGSLAGIATVEIGAYVGEDFSRLTQEQRANAPAMKLETEKLDFGAMPASEAATRSFTIKNTGKNKLELRRIYPVDAGITVKCGRTTLKHGQTAKVTVTVDAASVADGVLNSRIIVATNDPALSRGYVRLVGLVKKN